MNEGKSLKIITVGSKGYDQLKRVYSDTIKAFSGYDVKTEIHGQHIYKGKVGTWKEFLEDPDLKEMTFFWRDQLIRWGYEL